MSGHDDYRSLRADRVLQTLERLRARIVDRFPDADLVDVCAAVLDAARASAAEAAGLARPNLVWRAALTALIVGGLAAQWTAFRFMHVEIDGAARLGAAEVLQSLEAAVNLLILFGGAVWFLVNLEEGIKRRRALASLHRLRSLAHVIDMHQLTKDPTMMLGGARTPASPERGMSRFELTRYLEYCSEMLALTGKLAALYGEGTRDGVVVDAINDIENLTSGLGRKIWQKITILGALEGGALDERDGPPG